MSPQPKQSEESQPKESRVGQHSDAVNELLEFAQELGEEKGLLQARIAANRDTLRNYKRMGLLSDEQSKAIDEFYPPVVRKPKEAAA